MSLVRFLPAWLHAIADYAVGIALIVVATVVTATDKAIAAGVVIGAVILLVSLLTRYPLGLIKVLPFKVHSAGDYLAAALLIASPFALQITSSDRALSIVYFTAGVAVLGVSLITNYQYSPKRQEADVRPARASSTTAPAADRGEADQWFNAAAKARQPLPTYAAEQPVAAESWRSERVQAEPRAAQPVAASRSLREILAERAAGNQSAA